jgi:flagellar assembly protein FliH
LFDEDFDLPPPSATPSEPEVIAPLFTLDELRTAREDAARDSREATLVESAAGAAAATSRALASIAEQFSTARAEIASMAEQSSEAIVRLLLDCFATALPALSARHGAREAAAMLHRILPALHRELKITVRVNPHIVAVMAREIDSLDADLAANIRLVPTDAVVPGDVRIAWEHGAAVRDMKSLWQQIESILAPAGLLNTERTAKEHELV